MILADMGAVVCIFFVLSRKRIPLTIPVLTELVKFSGLPTATTVSPTEVVSPRGKAGISIGICTENRNIMTRIKAYDAYNNFRAPTRKVGVDTMRSPYDM